MPFNPFAWLRRPSAPRRAASPPARLLPEVEPLEQRWMPATLTLSSSTYTVGEADGTVTITVNADVAPGAGQKYTVNYATSDGTATTNNPMDPVGGKDYTSASGMLQFDPGQTSKTFTVTIGNDSGDEPDETFTVTLSGAMGASLGSPASATVTITDDDATPTVQFGASEYKFFESHVKLTATVTLSAASARTVTVSYGTSDGTATAGTDYTAASGTLTFNPGDTSKTFDVSYINDSLDEFDETIVLTLSNPTNATLGTQSTSTGKIEDEDSAPEVKFQGAMPVNYSVAETAGSATATVALSAASGKTVTVTYATSDGTATAGTDYTAVTGTLTFTPGQTTRTFPILITNDEVSESSETVNLTLSSPTNATLGAPSTATVTITNATPTDFPLTNPGPTPDPLGDILFFGDAGLGPQDGNLQVRVDVPLGTCGCSGTTNASGGPLSLVYNSNTVDVRPTVEVQFTTPSTASVPTLIEARLTWNGGSPGSWVSFTTTNHAPGDIYRLALQVGSAVSSTGRYSFSVDVRATFSDRGQVLRTASGNAIVVSNDASPYGAGWTVAEVDRLVSVTGGVIYVYGGGGARFFSGSGPTYTSPAADFGTLVRHGDNSYTYTALDGSQRKFDTSGYQTRTLDTFGVGATYTYSSGRLTSLNRPDSGTSNLGYDGSNLLQSVPAPGGALTTISHTGTDLTGVQFPDGGLRTFTYDANHRLTNQRAENLNTTYSYNATTRMVEAIDRGNGATATLDAAQARALGTSPALGSTNAGAVFRDALGQTTTVVLDGAGRRTKETAPDGGVMQWERNSAGRPTVVTDQLGRKTTYAYDAYGQATRVDHADGTYELYAYESTFHQLTRHEDQLHRVATYTYDGATGARLTERNALNEVTTYTYSASGQVQTVTDPLNRTTTYLYDSSLRMTATIDALNNRTTYAYDAAGNLTAVTDPLGRVTTSVYDVMRRVTAQVDALGNTTTSVYDTRGNLVRGVDPLGRVTTYLYDSLNRQTEVIDALGNRATTVYDALDRVQASVDPLNRRTTYAYDAVGRQTRVTAPDGGVTTSAYDSAGQLTASIDQLDHRTTYQYDAVGRQTAVIDALGNRATTVYDDAGQVTASIDPRGNRTTYAYDAAGRQTVSIDALGNRSTSVYDAAGQVTTSIDPRGNRTTYLYDAAGRQTETIDALGNRATSVYDNAGQVTATLDALNRRTTYLYDAAGRQTATIDALNQVTTTAYDAAGNVTRTVNARGFATTYVYDGLNRQTETIDTLGNRTTSVYDAAGQMTATVGELNHRTTYAYDVAGRQMTVTDPLGNVTTNAYDAAGNVTRVTNARGFVTTYVYNALNRQTETIDALSNRATLVYDAAGNVTVQIDARGNRTTSTYDALNRVTARTDALNHTVTTAYDAAGNGTRTVDASGFATTYAYDALNRQTAVTAPSGGITTTAYDAVGNVTNRIDGLNHKTTYVYDALNRKTADVDALSGTTTYAYDAAGNRTVLVDPVGNRTTSAYDALDRLTQETDPLNASATFAYDAAGRMTSTTDRLGRRREFAFDDGNRKTAETWVESGGGIANRQTFTYDAVGNQLTARDANGAYTMAYDALDRVTRQDQPFGQVLTFTYDAAGNRTRMDDSQGGVTTSVYDAANRLTRRDFGGSGLTPLRFDWTYTNRDQQETLTRYSDLAGTTKVGESVYTYDAAGRLENLKHKNGSSTVLANYTYTYDLADRVTGEVTNGTPKTYSYDHTDQVTNDSTATYTYDANGNRTMAGYQTGAGNQLTNDGTWTYTYDAEGSNTKKSKGASLETWTYGFDHLNRLVWVEQRATDGGTLLQRVDYKYDVFGNRIERVHAAGGTTTERFVYLDKNAWADLNGSNVLTVRRLFGDRIDELIAQIDSVGAPKHYLLDRLGSVKALTDSAGVLKDEILYDAYGNVLSESDGAYSDRYKFTGREAESAETGLYYYRWRFYRSSTGSLLSRDPIGFEAGDSNIYRYVRNTPVSHSDPLGLFRVTRITVSDQSWRHPRAFVPGGLVIGPDEFAFGFNAKVEGISNGPNDSITRNADIKQYVWRSRYYKHVDPFPGEPPFESYLIRNRCFPGIGRIYWNGPNPTKNEGTLEEGRRTYSDWKKGMFASDLDIDVSNSRGNFPRDYKIDWYRWADLPGHTSAERRSWEPNPLRALGGRGDEIKLSWTFRIVARGDDGSEVVAQFTREQTAKYDGRTWNLTQQIGPNPKLPNTWP